MKTSILILTLSCSTAFCQNTTKGYTSISDGLKEPEKVQVLEVSSPDSLNFLSEFVNLKSLSIYNYTALEAPAVIGDLSNLEELRFVNDDFYLIPDSYAKLKNLKKIEIIHDSHLNLQNALIVLNKMEGLKELRIEGVQNVYFNDDVQFPKNLAVLSLRNNHLNLVPEGIKELSNLRMLDLGENDLFYLPSYFSELNQLELLHLDHQPYLNFKSAFFVLNAMKGLKIVNLQQNGLKQEHLENWLVNKSLKVIFEGENYFSDNELGSNMKLDKFEISKFSSDPNNASFKIPLNK